MKFPRYILGAPLSRAKQKEFEEALLARFDNDIERAIKYADETTSSQVNRASGILASTSILAGMSYFVNAPVALIFALVSLILIASTLYVSWPSAPSSIGEAELEFVATCRRCYQRAICNRISITLVILTVIFLLPYIFSRSF